MAETIFQCVGTFLLRLAAHCCACCLRELGKILFGVFLEKTTGLGRRWTFFVINGLPDFHHEYLWQWVYQLGDCAASSPSGLRGFFLDFGVLTSTSFLSFTGSSRLPCSAPVAHPWRSRHRSPGFFSHFPSPQWPPIGYSFRLSAVCVTADSASRGPFPLLRLKRQRSVLAATGSCVGL